MDDGEVFLTAREADRVAVIREVAERRLRQSEAALRLGLSVRQVKRLVRRYRERGASGLVSVPDQYSPEVPIENSPLRAIGLDAPGPPGSRTWSL